MTNFDPFVAQHFINNEVHPARGAARDILNPSTLAPCGRIADATADEIDRAFSAAEAARPAWSRLDAKSRAQLLHALANSIEQSDKHDVARLMTLEVGKPYPESIGELANVPTIFRYYAEMARDDAGKVAGPMQAGSFQYARYFPYGTSVHIVPYNFPILLMAWTLAASLAAGNVAIVKPAEAGTLCTLKFLEHFQVLPPGVVNLLTGGPAVGKALVNSPRTHIVAFTGSVAAARSVAAACAVQLKSCLIEAGGNDPLIVSDKAPLEVAVAGSVTAAFHLSGQICTSAERFFVHEKIHDAFVAGLVAGARRLRVGDGLGHHEIGPLASEAARNKVIRLVDDAVSRGAKIATGGRIPPHLSTGWFYEPTVLTGVTPGMPIFHEELFGPVAPICPVGSFDEALALANRSEFGLGANLFTTDLAEAMRAAEELQGGMVWVNNPLIDNDALPFGGCKNSGLGRSLSRLGLDTFRQSKMIVIDPQPHLHDWWYPYPDSVFYDSRPAGQRTFPDSPPPPNSKTEERAN
jgi:acyl-CoA reductase-like NAD-dependent aldehyde dehydrogenase